MFGAAHNGPTMLPPISNMTASSRPPPSSYSSAGQPAPHALPHQLPPQQHYMQQLPPPQSQDHEQHQQQPSSSQPPQQQQPMPPYGYYRDQHEHPHQPMHSAYSAYPATYAAYPDHQQQQAVQGGFPAMSSHQQPGPPPHPSQGSQAGWYSHHAPRSSIDSFQSGYSQYDARSIAESTSSLAPQSSAGSAFLSGRGGPGAVQAPRMAPQITSPMPDAPNPNGPVPVKGFPYAFPDPDAASVPSAPPSSAGSRPSGGPPSSNVLYPHHTNGSRKSVDSYRSSRSFEMDDSAAGAANGGPNGGASSALNSGPYSRSPELRQTHKIAERRRRRDMTLLYEDLKNIMPEEKGVKSSKHEILTRAINVIKYYMKNQDELHAEVNDLREQLKLEPKKFAPMNISRNSPGPNGHSTGSEDEDEAEPMDYTK
ncbi:uncharacterized protein V1518DRAFT_409091 [Limtongia smithiae]|uniref:uncharacterized protein n=1 Tax=Limtongia smithiae TaxID=1125753 RepID=UPI0034CFBD0A